MVSTNWRKNTPIISGNSLFLIDNNNILYGINAINGKLSG